MRLILVFKAFALGGIFLLLFKDGVGMIMGWIKEVWRETFIFSFPIIMLEYTSMS